jgi:hypothetical protein
VLSPPYDYLDLHGGSRWFINGSFIDGSFINGSFINGSKQIP